MCEESFDVIPIFNWVNFYFTVKLDTFGKAIIWQTPQKKCTGNIYLFGFIKIFIEKNTIVDQKSW